MELARINLDQKKFKEALAYYDELLLSLMKIKLDSARPESFATILSEYSTCLNELGRNQDANTVDALIKRLQTEYHGGFAIQKRIPYGNRTVSFPIPSHKFETAEPEPVGPVDLNLHLTKKTAPADNLLLNSIITQILIQIIINQ